MSRLDQFIAEHNGVLIRDKKHLVYEFPNKFKLVVSKTPSSDRHENETITTAMRGLGLTKRVAVEGERRDRRRKNKHSCSGKITAAESERLTMKDQLKEIIPMGTFIEVDGVRYTAEQARDEIVRLRDSYAFAMQLSKQRLDYWGESVNNTRRALDKLDAARARIREIEQHWAFRLLTRLGVRL